MVDDEAASGGEFDFAGVDLFYLSFDVEGVKDWGGACVVGEFGVGAWGCDFDESGDAFEGCFGVDDDAVHF